MAINRIAVVTGGSRGIGAGLADYFRSQGVEVWTPTRQSMDVSDINSVINAFKTISETGQIRLLVNCAAINDVGPVNTMASSEWEKIFKTNLVGTANCSRAAVPYMDQGGSIINMSSIVARTGLENGAAYAASKAAVEAFTKSFAKEVGPVGITVNALALGYFDCGLIRDVPEKTRESIIRRTPVRRLGRADEVGAMCLYLDSARFVTGAVIPMDGGL